MCPYGICRTTIFELLDTQASGELALEVPIESTDEQGVLVGTPQAQLTILLPDRKPFAKELVLIRNTDSSRERWYKTDEVGKVDVELPSDPAIAVIVHRNKVFRYSLSQHCSAPNPSSYVDLECHVLARGSIVLGLP